MTAQVHLNHPFLTIYWDSERFCVWMEWKRFVKGDEFREGLEEGLELLRRKGAHRWLADCRNLSVVDLGDQAWTIAEWYPRAVRAGIRRMAIVWPEHSVARASVMDIMGKAQVSGMVVESFYDLAAARDWLTLFPPPGETPGRPQVT